MSKLRTFKAQKGKVLYCPSGDIVFTDGFYATENQDEIDTIEKGVGIEEITDTKEAKEATNGQKKTPLKKDDKKDEKKDEKSADEKKADEEAKQEKFQKEIHGFDTPKDLEAQVLADIEKCETGVKLDEYNAENPALKDAIEKRRVELEPKTSGDDVPIEDMPVEDLKKYLDQREVGYADDITEDDLRNLVNAESVKEANEANDLGLKDDEDIEVMPKPRCQEVLKHAGVAFEKKAGVTDLRSLVEKLR